MLRKALEVAGFLALIAGLGLIAAVPAGAVTTVQVSIPVGAGNPSGAPGYSPDQIVVVIGVNNTVEWTNKDTLTHHTVTSSLVPNGAGQISSGDMAPGANFTYTFTVPGTYDYYCAYHSWMTGTVVVKAASSTPTPEFPGASLVLVLFAVFALAAAASPRLRGPLAAAAKS